jgi:hypothetical protein
LIYSLYQNEYRILKPYETTIRKGMKKMRGDKPIVITIYLYMEVPQGNSLCVTIFYKIGELKGRTNPAWGCWYQWEGEGRKKIGRVNIVQILSIHV